MKQIEKTTNGKRILQSIGLFFMCCAVLGGCSAFSPSAHSVYRMPDTMKLKLIQALDDRSAGCTDGYELNTGHYYELDDGSLVLFMGIPDYLCTMSNTFIPVVVTLDGKWKSGDPMEGAPHLFTGGHEKNTVWLSAQWQIEGTSPSLYHSVNGYLWKEVTLPAERNVDCCFEWIDSICLKNGHLFLTFHGDSEGRTEAWGARVDTLLQPSPDWIKIKPDKEKTINTSSGVSCESVMKTNGNWNRVAPDNSNEVHFQFRTPQKKTTVIIPGVIH